MLDHDVRGLMDAIVPISRFNKGEAGKIFEEVTSSGVKIVVTSVRDDDLVYNLAERRTES